MIGGRCPAGHEYKLEGFAPSSVHAARREACHHRCKPGTQDSGTLAARQQIAGGHPPQIAGKPQRVAVTDFYLNPIADGQRESGALEEIASSADVYLRMDASGYSVIAGHVGGENRPTQHGQAARTNEAGQEQAVWS